MKNANGLLEKVLSGEEYSGYRFTCTDRFLKYVKYDTQSNEESLTLPSTEKQKVLLKELLSELKGLGIKAEMDKYGYVYAKIKSNCKGPVPPIGVIAHVDTSPDVSGANVKPIVHKNYQGGDIILPKDNQTISLKDNPELFGMKGYDIITSDGSTLLGADDKAGVAIIMDAVTYISKHPKILHGDIMIAFTMDEEVGRGTEKFDIKKFGAKYAYTIDGDTAGSMDLETFNANNLVIGITGKNIHTGYAKGKMINSLKIASEFISSLPKDKAPETTSGKEGFMHVDSIQGNPEYTKLMLYLRDFEEKRLAEYQVLVDELLKNITSRYPGSSYDIETKARYRNMKYILDKNPKVTEYLSEAITRAGLKPNIISIRGGTDGCNLSYMGLPTPNVFAGEHQFHSKAEWTSRQELEAGVRTIVELCKVWAEKSRR